MDLCTPRANVLALVAETTSDDARRIASLEPIGAHLQRVVCFPLTGGRERSCRARCSEALPAWGVCRGR